MYRQMGNSVAVPGVTVIAKQMREQIIETAFAISNFNKQDSMSPFHPSSMVSVPVQTIAI
jgi:hypothetical protein